MGRASRQLRARISALPSDNFQLGAVATYDWGEVLEGYHENVGLKIFDGELSVTEAFLPDPRGGRWSEWNANGREVVRRDLPKVPRSSVTWVYPYGNKARSQVPAYRTRYVFPQETIHGRGLRFNIEASGSPAEGVKLSVRVDRVFDKAVQDDDPDLAMATGLLREHFGEARPLPVGENPAQWFARRREIDWQLLPPGLSSEELVREVSRRLAASPDSPTVDVAKERLANIMSLNPTQIAVGSGDFDRYVAYIFRADLVVLENLTYGNAAYVMYEDWESLSRRSRLELLASPELDFTRVVHTGNWRALLRETIRRSGRRR